MIHLNDTKSVTDMVGVGGQVQPVDERSFTNLNI